MQGFSSGTVSKLSNSNWELLNLSHLIKNTLKVLRFA